MRRSFLSHTHTPISARSEYMHTHTYTHSKVLPPTPSSPAATLRERSKISLNKEASGDRQTAPAPPFKEGETQGGRGCRRERGGVLL